MIMKRKFIAFLKQNGAYDAFVGNLENTVCNGAGATIPTKPAETLISRAFVWRLTPEGFDFWSALSLRWECICSKQKEE
jgi:hypothetical protein